jgi:hypothetical protein
VNGKKHGVKRSLSMAHSPIHLLLIDLAEGVCKSLEVAELEQRIGALEEKAKSKNM